MEPSEIQTSLEELEERIDRVRALYEQYFCGIEKIEPQIPRKDVDRRIYLLRKEQIRNTAMRFKFQTLVQRYSTMSQHWGRVLREIENGTFKRDLARAAARFGVEEALTAVGKKRAERLAKGLEAQIEREARRKQAQKQADDYEVVDDADIEVEDDFDDDAPTPPPVSRVPGAQPSQPQQAFGVVYADGLHDGGADADLPPNPGAPKPRASRTGFGAFGNLGATARPGASATQPPSAFAQGGPPPDSYSQPHAPNPQQFAPTPYAPPVGLAAPQDAQAPGQKKSGGGLRLGGGPSKRANSEALTRIASTLTDDAPGAGGRKPLISSPIDVELGPEPQPPPSSPAPRAPAERAASTPAPASVRKPLLSAPLDIDLGSAPEPPPPAPARAPAASAAPSPAPPPAAEKAEKEAGKGLGLKPPPRASGEGGSGPAPNRPARSSPDAERSAPQARANESRAKPAEDISDQRLREIYSQYVTSRRERNESTAGITFEKLADSLRSQADKLRSKHAAKRVDYEIVVKDGKTLIKPIVR